MKTLWLHVVIGFALYVQKKRCKLKPPLSRRDYSQNSITAYDPRLLSYFVVPAIDALLLFFLIRFRSRAAGFRYRTSVYAFLFMIMTPPPDDILTSLFILSHSRSSMISVVLYAVRARNEQKKRLMMSLLRPVCLHDNMLSDLVISLPCLTCTQCYWMHFAERELALSRQDKIDFNVFMLLLNATLALRPERRRERIVNSE